MSELIDSTYRYIKENPGKDSVDILTDMEKMGFKMLDIANGISILRDENRIIRVWDGRRYGWFCNNEIKKKDAVNYPVLKGEEGK